MLKIKNIKSFLLVAGMLMGGSISFAQVVTVPLPCVVVDPGVGGSIVLNQVGNGGVVRMADNYAGGVFSCSTPAGYTLTGWSLKGDLSVTTTNIPPAAPVQPVGALSSYSIQSYNKFLRPSEGLTGSAASKLAKSKGEVRIGFSTVGCGGYTISFQVYKTYASASAPAIAGPTCIPANIPCTFSVDRVASDNATDNIGFDQYYWSFVDGAGFAVAAPAMAPNSLYYSADNSSITFTPTASTGFTIKCALGKANSSPWSTTANDGPNPSAGFTYPTFVIKIVGALPTAPTLTSVPSTYWSPTLTSCIDTGVSSLAVTYAYPPAGTTYTWSTPNNWVLTTNNTATITLNVALDNNSGELRLRVTNSCTSVDYVYKIGRRFTSAVAITGSSCITTGTQNSYSIGTDASVNTTEWTVTVPPSTVPVSGFTISPNSLTTTVNVYASATVPPGQYTLTAKSNPLVYNGYACQGSITKIINIKPPIPAFTTTTPTCVLKGSTAVTSIQVDTTIAGTPTTGYVWDLLMAPGWTINTIGADTSTPTFIPNGTTNGPVTIKVKRLGTNGCDSDQVIKTINYIAINTLFNSNTSFCDQYALSCGTLVSWVVNGNTLNPLSLPANITMSGNTLLICGNNGTLTSVCANVSGIATPVCVSPLGTHGLRPSAVVSNGGSKLEGIKMYPNPNKGEFYIKVDDYKYAVGAIITDSSGKELGTYELTKGENKISTSNLSKGVYFVTLLKDGQSEVRQIIIE